MFKIKNFLVDAALIVLLFTVIGCSDNGVDSEKNNGLYIRIENASHADFENILVVFPNDSVYYGDINAGNTSSYKEVELAYSYAYVEFFVDDQKYILQPIDYLGEIPLENGYYTYILNISGGDMFDVTLFLDND